MIPPHTPRGALLAKIGAWMQLAQLAGLAGMMIKVSQIKAAIGPRGTSDPGVSPAAMNDAFIPALIGIGIAIVGVILIIIAATALRYRAAWFYSFLWIYGAAMTLSHMMPFGIFVLIYALKHRHEFEKETPGDTRVFG